ncbi:methyltransferase [Bdellovibrio bacteriovorus W]|nr:methyltransferase [Bdellovibrio bacteriovorus W]
MSVIAKPDHTAIRVALWRALHKEVDAKPLVLDDTLALELADPESNWRERQDMDVNFTKIFRASIVGRARFIEDLVLQTFSKQTSVQYVILGAGLDSFALRHAQVLQNHKVFEIDTPAQQAWKQNRVAELELTSPKNLIYVPVDFEKKEDWILKLVDSGFQLNKPAVVVSTGVSMYLTKDANMETLANLSRLAPGSIFAMTYLLPMEDADEEEKFGREVSEKGARSAGTPFISFYREEDVIAMALEAGFSRAHVVKAKDLNERYFSQRSDGLHATKSEEILIAEIE